VADVLKTAKACLDRGLAVVPLFNSGADAKKADENYNAKAYTLDDFEGATGIAIKNGKPSGWWVDVDLDCREAIEAAKHLLPRTLTHGRPGKPDSHGWFVSEGATSKQFPDVGKAKNMLAEIRSTGGYTVLPPSLHPSGERYAWSDVSVPPMELPFDELLQVVTYVAVAALVARRWSEGSRHFAAGALAGFLLQHKVEPTWVRQIVRATLHASGDPDVSDRMAFTSETITKFEKGERVTGGPKLADYVGEDVVKRLKSWMKTESRETREVQFRTADTISPEATEWLYDSTVPRGFFGLLGGREGLGKSLTLVDLAARITKGTLPGCCKGQPKSVILAATEDSWSHVIVPRLIAAGSDLTKIIHANVVTTGGETELTLPVDIEGLKQKIQERGDVALMILDPLLSRLATKLNTHVDAEVRQACEPLVKLAEVTGVSVIGIIHVNKTATTDPLTSIMGSRAFAAVARFVLFVVEDPTDESYRLFGLVKNNFGSSNGSTQRFCVQEVDLGEDAKGKRIKTGKIAFEGDDSRSIRDALVEAADADKKSQTAEAMRWLKTYLKSNGVTPYQTIKQAGAAQFFYPRLLERAAKRLGVVIAKMPGTKGKTTWSLPQTTAPTQPTVF
jgi:hypothetical protein